MNYMSELNAFYDWLETNPLATSCIVLWHALMHVNNKAGWPDTFAVAVSVLELKTGLKRDTIYEARNKLDQAGRIKWESRKGNQSAVYRMIPFVSDKPTQIPIQHPTQYPIQTPMQSPTINKLNNIYLVDEEESQLNAEEKMDIAVKQIIKSYSENIGLLTPSILCKIEDYLYEGIEAGAVIFAIEQASAQGKRFYSYIEGILNGYKSNGILTRAEAENAKRVFDEGKNRKNERKVSGSSNTSSKPTFNNFKNRTYDAKALEEAWLNASK